MPLSIMSLNGLNHDPQCRGGDRPHQGSWHSRAGKLGDLVILDGDPLADSSDRLCTKNTSWALIERPYSCAPKAVGAVYDRPGFFVQPLRSVKDEGRRQRG